MHALSRIIRRSNRNSRRRQSARRWKQRRLLLEPLEIRQVLTSAISTSVDVTREDSPTAEKYAYISRADGGGDYTDTLQVCYSVVGSATPGVDHTLPASGCVNFAAGQDVVSIPIQAIDDPYYEFYMERGGDPEYFDGHETVMLDVTSWTSSNPEKVYEVYEFRYGVIDDEMPWDPPQPKEEGCETCSDGLCPTSPVLPQHVAAKSQRYRN